MTARRKSACSRDPDAGPGSCWFWWESCPAKVRDCYFRRQPIAAEPPQLEAPLAGPTFEAFTLPDLRPNWRGLPPARITLARRGDQWMVAAEAALSDRGFGESTAWWEGERRRTFPTRALALACGMGSIRQFLDQAGDRRGVKRISAWLDQLAIEEAPTIDTASPPPLKRYVLRRDR